MSKPEIRLSWFIELLHPFK